MHFRPITMVSLLAVAASFVLHGQTVSSGGVVNAASFLPAVAPGSVISIFGTNLAAGNAGAAAVPLPTSLGGTSVTVNGKAAPLFFVSPTQINAQLPYEIAPGSATLVVTANGVSTRPVPFNVLMNAPGILVYGSNRAVALNLDGSLNGPDKPAMPGSLVTVYLLGQGPTDIPVVTGQSSPGNPIAHATQRVSAALGGRTADIQFAGLSPGGVGLFQINLRIPVLASGDSALVVTIGGTSSNSAMLMVTGPTQAPPATTIVRTIAYHQLTSLPDKGPDYRTSTALSGNGAVIAFAHDSGPNQVYVMNFDGSGQQQVDSYKAQCYCGSIIDISDDASKVVSTEGRQIRIVDDKGPRMLVNVDTGISGIKMEGDGRRVFFLLDRDGNFVANGKATGPAQRGLYVINTDGTGFRQIVGPNAVAALFGNTVVNYYSPSFTVTGNAANHSLSVTQDGTHIVFGAQKIGGGGPDAIFGVNLDGSGLHFVLGPVPYVEHLAVSAAALKVLYDTFDGHVVETGVINFDGTSRLALRTDGIGNFPGVQLTADGSQALAFDILYNTDGSGALQLSTTFNALTPGSPVMNATATRFVYPFVVPGTYSQGLTQLASAEINPLNLGASPTIANPMVTPAYVMPDDLSKATASAQVSTANHLIQVGYATARNGLIEYPPTANVSLFDNGANGDQVADDGNFTTNLVQAPYKSATGPRTLRLFAQVQDATGIRHGTLVDVAPFFVLPQPPTGPAPSISAITSSNGSAATQVTISGSGFDSTPGNNQVILGSRLARVLTSSGTQLTILVPPDATAGPANVIVATQGQASNAMPFVVK